MKFILLTFSVFFLVSCNDTLRSRVGKCRGADNRFIECSANQDALSTDVFRKKYIAEVTLPVEVGQSQIIMTEFAQDSDHDQEHTCELEVSEGKKFNYTIQQNKLLLQDGLSTLVFIRTNGNYTKELTGSWSMKEEIGDVQTITEIIFKNLEEIRIRKVCNLR